MKRSVFSVINPVFLLCFCACCRASDDGYSVFNLLFDGGGFADVYEDAGATIWRSSIANDAMGGKHVTDQYYTNALRVMGYQNVQEAFLLDGHRLFGLGCDVESNGRRISMQACHNKRLGLSSRDVKYVSYGSAFGHHLYTPYEHAGRGHVPESQEGYEYIENAEYFDRPYAAWAYWARNLIISSEGGYQAHEMSYGVVGPGARGRWIQEKAHEYPFKGPSPIDGWETQVENRLALQYAGKFASYWGEGRALLGQWRVAHYGLVEAGTIINRVGYGVEVSAGWPEKRQCSRFSASGLVFLGSATEMFQSGLGDYQKALDRFLDEGRYLPDRIFIALMDLKDQINRLSDGGGASVVRSERLLEVEGRLMEIDAELRRMVLAGCQYDGLYTEVMAQVGAHYVISNYLVDGNIQVPAGANPNSANAVMRQGGELGVTRKPLVVDLSVGFDLGYREDFTVGYRFNYRTEETVEQVEGHTWSELVFESKSRYGWVTIPALLIAAALNNTDNWPN